MCCCDAAKINILVFAENETRENFLENENRKQYKTWFQNPPRNDEVKIENNQMQSKLNEKNLN